MYASTPPVTRSIPPAVLVDVELNRVPTDGSVARLSAVGELVAAALVNSVNPLKSE